MKEKTFERVLWDVARFDLRGGREQQKTHLLVSLRQSDRKPQSDSTMERRE